MQAVNDIVQPTNYYIHHNADSSEWDAPLFSFLLNITTTMYVLRSMLWYDFYRFSSPSLRFVHTARSLLS